jgi:hypothetical protein
MGETTVALWPPLPYLREPFFYVFIPPLLHLHVSLFPRCSRPSRDALNGHCFVVRCVACLALPAAGVPLYLFL